MSSRARPAGHRPALTCALVGGLALLAGRYSGGEDGTRLGTDYVDALLA
jgi:hypothetical protein